VSTAVLVLAGVGVLASGVLLAWSVDANVAGWVVAQCVALLAAVVVTLHTTRRFGGVTGDVFGALVELTTTLTLVGLAVS
jgi:adenosylcobinamide-GDP ribazoletransferase